jgi:hypothetical protein
LELPPNAAADCFPLSFSGKKSFLRCDDSPGQKPSIMAARGVTFEDGRKTGLPQSRFK